MFRHKFCLAVVFTSVVAMMFGAGNQFFGRQDQPPPNAASSQGTPSPTPTPTPTPPVCDLIAGFTGFRTQTGGGLFRSCAMARAEAAFKAINDCITTTRCSVACKNLRKTCKPVLGERRFTRIREGNVECVEMLTYTCDCECRK